MRAYKLRAVTRNEDGKTTNIVRDWTLSSASIGEARNEVDDGRWGGDSANAFEIVHETDKVVAWRPIQSGGEPGDWVDLTAHSAPPT